MSAPPRHLVTAVVVSHDGERWLGELIAGLRQQRRPADRVLVVDTGSQDASREMLARAFSPEAVLGMSATTGFGAAVGQAVRHLPPPAPDAVEWLWVLHDDCAPTPGALAEMMLLLEEVPAAAVVGPKLRSWPRGRQLLELGVTITGSGMRETGLEYAEFDQGQHDVVRETLGVSTAGMLVRRDVFERVGGFDPQIKLFRDDVDFGWRVHRAGHHIITCPDAIVFHAEASGRGARPLDAVRGVRPRRADRISGIYTLLVNCTWWAFPFVALRMVFGSLLRTLGLLVVKWPDAAYDEFRALLSIVIQPHGVFTARLRRSRVQRISRRKFRHLFPPPWIGPQHGLETLTGLFSTSADTGSHAGSRKRRKVVETGPIAEEAEDLAHGGGGRLARLVTRPPVLLVLGLLTVSLIAGRELLFGGGSLGGGALLPAPGSAWDLWQRYVESWHPVELGSSRPAPPYLAIVAGLGTLFLGNVALAIDLLMLGAAPLAGMAAYLFTREFLRARPVRIWASATYGLVPAVTGAVATGRLGTCVAAILLPLLGLAVVRALRHGSWSATWSAALLLAVMTSFVPLAYPAAAVVGVVAATAYRSRQRAALRVAVVLAVPPALLLPWLPVFVDDPQLVLGEAGRTSSALADPDLPAYVLALGSPGGPGVAPFWILGVLAPVALAALLRRDRSRGVIAAWVVAGVGVVLGLAQSRASVEAAWLPSPVPAWPAFAAVLVIAGWVAALSYAADGVGQVFSRRSFSWRQPTAGLLALLAVAAPTMAGVWWVLRGADGPLERLGPALPAYIANVQDGPGRPRTLVLRLDGDEVRYALIRGDGARLGDAATGSSAEASGRMNTVVGDMLGNSHREDAAEQLATFGVGFVYMPAPADKELAQRLDTTPGLTRASAPEEAGAWRLEDPGTQARLLPKGGRDPVEAEHLGSRPDLKVPDGPAGRRLVLSEAYDPDWQATLDGHRLEPVQHAGWAQAFELPAGGGTVRAVHDEPLHSRLLVLQGVLALLVLIFALPSRARRDSDGPAAYVEGGKHGAAGGPIPDLAPARRRAEADFESRVPEEVGR